MTGTPRPPTARAAYPADALPPGTRLAEFEILSVLGAGGFGMVYQAFDHSLLRHVAIKEYLPAALAGRPDGQSLWVRTSSDEPSFQAGLASFVEEARLLARFDHPSLVKVFRFWEAHQTAYMVMPLYVGMTLKQARARMAAPPPEAWLRKVLWSVLDALRELHGAQTLHRDISPDNIFLQDRGPPVLLDLGAARNAIHGGGYAPATVLKVSYAPLEQYAGAGEGLEQGPWSDLYALGAVVHGCLCNDTPLPATLRSLRDRMVPFPRVARTVRRQFGAGYSPGFVAAVSQALALRPEGRPASIDAFLRAMGMTEPPEGLAHFDFRAELGRAWGGDAPDTPLAEPAGGHGPLPPQRPAAPGPLPGAGREPPVERRRPRPARPQDRPPAAVDGAPPFAQTVVAEGAGRPRPRRSGRRAALAWPLAGMVLLLAAGSGSAWWLQQGVRRPPEPGLAMAWAEPVPAPAADAGAGAARVSAAQAGPAAVPAVAQAHGPALPPARPPVPRAAAAAPAQPPQRPGPDAVCADAGFLLRPLCLHRACQAAAQAQHPACVQARHQREEEDRRQRLLAPQ